jgi:hypothetical protein
MGSTRCELRDKAADLVSAEVVPWDSNREIWALRARFTGGGGTFRVGTREEADAELRRILRAKASVEIFS